jgi:ribonuclease HII
MDSRFFRLTYEERKLLNDGYELLAGVDEAGRGPLAGPVVAACVIFPKDLYLDGIDDSKKLSAKKREKVYRDIMSTALSVGVGIVDHETVDHINILNATCLAMRKAIMQCCVKPDILLIDAVVMEDCGLPLISFIKGDERSHCIAAASIIAKVTRDREMLRLHEIYPQYGFGKHKGYGTAEHIGLIRKLGISPIHRRTFCSKFFPGDAIE